MAAPAAPLAAHQLLIFLVQAVVLLGLAFGLGRLATRLGLPAVVGELLTGVLLGPSVLGHVSESLSGWVRPAEVQQTHLLDAVAQIGLLLLVGVTGTHLDLAMLRRRHLTAVRVSLAGLVLPLAFGVALGVVLPARLMQPGAERGVFALFLGVAMCVTAIPVIAKTLSDMRLLHRDVGQLTLAAGMVDDTVGWFLLSVVSAVATVGVRPSRILLSVLYLLGFTVFALLVARPVVGWALRRTAGSPEAGPSIAVTVITILLGAATTQALGMESVFGAFVAGLLVGAPRAADQAKLAPLRAVVLSVLAPLFLASAGLRVDLTALGDPTVAGTALAVVAVAIIGKFAGAYTGARLSRLGSWEAVAIGAGMNARGVVEVIVATVGLRVGVLSTAAYTIVVLVAIVTSLMAPPLLRLATARLDHSEEERLREAVHESWAGVAVVAEP